MTTPPGFAPSGFFVLRTPLLPFDELRAWGQGLLAPTARGASTAELEAALARDRELLRERLMSVIARPEVREALFLASPSLEENLPAWTAAPGSPHGEKLERTLVRYWQRMTSRATPFGPARAHDFVVFTPVVFGKEMLREVWFRGSVRAESAIHVNPARLRSRRRPGFRYNADVP